MDTKTWVIAIVLLIAVLILSNLVNGMGKNKKSKEKTAEEFVGKYKKRNLLSANEERAFNKIKEALRLLNLQLYTKVRLADIIEPKESGKEWKGLFYRIQAKHVDFLVVDNDFKPICIIEIDDKSHDNEKRVKRDKFVDFILNDVGIQTIRKRGTFTSVELQNEIRALMIKSPT